MQNIFTMVLYAEKGSGGTIHRLLQSQGRMSAG